ncbi:hypothetical protein DL95DRAFT_313806 [Leptodontidium sp. 2 PMI_412]|nr:hypothetical protein DL95DRAFT_313806 [Leptodontidium sp. 2 PMI_412]
MVLAQLFSSLMSVSIRILENSSSKMHPLQILFFRMSITTVALSTYIWKQKIPGFPVGRRENAHLLWIRAMGGFLGVFGLYYSLKYLDLSEATVITFLTPMLASFAGHFLLQLPFSFPEKLASAFPLVGVLLVASPWSLPAGSPNSDPNTNPILFRLSALGIGLIGVCGSAAAFLSMQALGKRENPLIVVNGFVALCCTISLVSLAIFPTLGGFVIPQNAGELFLLVLSAVCGFAMQLFITLSLQAEKSVTAMNMVYTQLVFALILDGIVLGASPRPSSIAGGTVIVGSSLFVAWHKARSQSCRDEVNEEV